jgi:hypothetical protein
VNNPTPREPLPPARPGTGQIARIVSAGLVALAAIAAIAASTTQAATERPAAADLLGAAATPPGAYDARLCVTVGNEASQCGPVAADVGDGGRLRVQISDIVYRLELWDDRLGVSLFHGTMQIDGFFARYQWSGRTLRFSDPDKDTRYELSLGARRFDTP